MIVAYKECQDCVYYSPIDKFYCHCSARDKKYHYGQWVPCEDKKPLEVTLPTEVEQSANDAPRDYSSRSTEKPKKKRKKQGE